ncbi:unnamed protein product [Nippostrongylus brasiliensis]|uniref:BAR domain-containing protein n=1 Tax=Nippostrongylus brasiliensis TaxID=27835 RepID=A0A158QYW8_NIPBR|nr:unnamed protein product [Nippostrongylus brasiliensis]
MADLRRFKSKISKACALVRSRDAEMEKLQRPFDFPTEKSQCEEFIRAKTADLNYLSRGITRGMQILDKYIKEAVEMIGNNINDQLDQYERRLKEIENELSRMEKEPKPGNITVERQPSTHSEAADFCRSKEGQLATIHSSEERTCIWGTVIGIRREQGIWAKSHICEEET